MARKTFFSFHYKPDNWRASTVRNIGAIEGNRPVSDNSWEEIKKKGDQAIKNWINKEMNGRTCTVVLIGSQTAGRKWIKHEIIESWNRGLGVVGIYIHNLKNRDGLQATKGSNPFDDITFDGTSKTLSSVVKAYDPPFITSQSVYNHISDNISKWVEQAITIRGNH